MTPLNSALPWLSDVRKSALVVFVAAVLALLMPLWRLAQQAGGLRSTIWGAVLIVFGYVFSAIMPVFYFALFRDEGTLRIPQHLRWLVLATAVVFGLFLAWDLSGRIGPFRYHWKAMATADWGSGSTAVLGFVRDPRTINQVANLLGECSDLAYVLLLVAFFRQSDRESVAKMDVPVSGFLRLVTKAAVVAYGIWIAFNVVRLAGIPFLHSYLQSTAFTTRLTLEPLGHWMLEAAQMLLTQACLFVAPYVVYNSWLRYDEGPDEVLPSPAGQLPT